MFNLNSLLVFSEDPKKLAEFYAKILEMKPVWSESDYSGFMLGDGMLIIGPHDKVHGANKNPERIMFNLETKDVAGDFKRLKEMGVKIIAQPYHPMEDSQASIATLADPDNNYFQLSSPMKM